MTTEDHALKLSKAVIRLHENQFIQAKDGQDEALCEYLSGIALHHAIELHNKLNKPE